MISNLFFVSLSCDARTFVVAKQCHETTINSAVLKDGVNGNGLSSWYRRRGCGERSSASRARCTIDRCSQGHYGSIDSSRASYTSSSGRCSVRVKPTKTPALIGSDEQCAGDRVQRQSSQSSITTLLPFAVGFCADNDVPLVALPSLFLNRHVSPW